VPNSYSARSSQKRLNKFKNQDNAEAKKERTETKIIIEEPKPNESSAENKEEKQEIKSEKTAEEKPENPQNEHQEHLNF